MNFDKPCYPLELSEDAMRFDFYSISETISIHKIVLYEPIIDSENYYQLSFGDLIDNKFVDYNVISNNNDMKLILTTVIRTVFIFFEKYPNFTIAFSGISESRTRFYRIIIDKLLTETELYFNVIGLNDDGTQEIFVKNKSYLAFLINLKDEK